MRNDVLKAQWKQVHGKIQEAWGVLTDDDLARVEGNWDQLVGKIEEKTGKKRQEIEKRLDDILAQYHDASPKR